MSSRNWKQDCLLPGNMGFWGVTCLPSRHLHLGRDWLGHSAAQCEKAQRRVHIEAEEAGSLSLSLTA